MENDLKNLICWRKHPFIINYEVSEVMMISDYEIYAREKMIHFVIPMLNAISENKPTKFNFNEHLQQVVDNVKRAIEEDDIEETEEMIDDDLFYDIDGDLWDDFYLNDEDASYAVGKASGYRIITAIARCDISNGVICDGGKESRHYFSEIYPISASFNKDTLLAEISNKINKKSSYLVYPGLLFYKEMYGMQFIFNYETLEHFTDVYFNF